MLHGRTRMFRIRGERGFTDTYLHILIQNYVNYLPIKNIFLQKTKLLLLPLRALLRIRSENTCKVLSTAPVLIKSHFTRGSWAGPTWARQWWKCRPSSGVLTLKPDSFRPTVCIYRRIPELDKDVTLSNVLLWAWVPRQKMRASEAAERMQWGNMGEAQGLTYRKYGLFTLAPEKWNFQQLGKVSSLVIST